MFVPVFDYSNMKLRFLSLPHYFETPFLNEINHFQPIKNLKLFSSQFISLNISHFFEIHMHYSYIKTKMLFQKISPKLKLKNEST